MLPMLDLLVKEGYRSIMSMCKLLQYEDKMWLTKIRRQNTLVRTIYGTCNMQLNVQYLRFVRSRKISIIKLGQELFVK